MKRVVFCCVAFLAVQVSGAFAQAARSETLAPRDVAGVLRVGVWRVGQVRPDTANAAQSGGGRRTIPATQTDNARTRFPSPRSPAVAPVVGGILGAGAGALLFSGLAGLGDRDAEAKDYLVGAAIGAALGASIGLLVDHLAPP